MKIVYCINSIRYWGGIQKVTIVKANALADISSNDVYIVVTDNKKGILTEPLSPKVHLIDLEINYFHDDWKGRLYTLKGIFSKYRKHKRKLTEILNIIQPDIVISTGLSEKFILPKIKGKWVLIRELHSNKNYRIDHSKNFYDKVKAFITNMYDYGYIIKKYDQIVLLTKEDKNRFWGNTPKLSVIPNPSTFTTNKISKLTNKRVISIGRLCPSKNYQSLISAFYNVAKKHPEWSLHIYGDGEDRIKLAKLITNLKLEKNVFLEGPTLFVENELANATLFAFSSISEGFGLTIVEAMTCGLPVISYACPSGPKDIITDCKDGFLVDINDEITLTNRINLLIENESLRKEMQNAALEKAKLFSIENIIPMWTNLFIKLINEKKERVSCYNCYCTDL
ncbi:MAG: glycosyltransferase family 4 protein [Bacteroides sp.]|nr:glycosyltransferase family 4 protein [Bacteroides sp.]